MSRVAFKTQVKSLSSTILTSLQSLILILTIVTAGLSDANVLAALHSVRLTSCKPGIWPEGDAH